MHVALNKYIKLYNIKNQEWWQERQNPVVVPLRKNPGRQDVQSALVSPEQVKLY